MSSIVLLASGHMARVDPSSVFLPGDTGNLETGLLTVHPELAEDDSVQTILQRLGLQRVSPELELEVALKKLRRSPLASDNECAEVWRIARSVGDDGSHRIGRSAADAHAAP